MKHFILIGILFLVTGCLTKEKKESNNESYYKKVIKGQNIWTVILQEKVSQQEGLSLKNSGHYVALAHNNDKNQMVKVIVFDNNKEFFQVSYSYDKDFFEGDVPFKRVFIYPNGKEDSKTHGAYKVKKNRK